MPFSQRFKRGTRKIGGRRFPWKNPDGKDRLLTGAIVAFCSAVSFGPGIYFVLSPQTRNRYGILWDFDCVCEIALTIFLFFSVLLAAVFFFLPVGVRNAAFRTSGTVCYWLSAACTAGFLLANADGGTNLTIGGVLFAAVLLRTACLGVSCRAHGRRLLAGTLWASRAAFLLSLAATVPTAAMTGFFMLLTLVSAVA